MKRLWDLSNDDLAGCPIWLCQGDSDDQTIVTPAGSFGEPDARAYIARTRFVLADESEWFASRAGETCHTLPGTWARSRIS